MAEKHTFIAASAFRHYLYIVKPHWHDIGKTIVEHKQSLRLLIDKDESKALGTCTSADALLQTMRNDHEKIKFKIR